MRLSQLRLRVVLISLTAFWLITIYYLSLNDISNYISDAYYDYDEGEIPREDDAGEHTMRMHPRSRSAGGPISWPNATIEGQPHLTQAKVIFLVVSSREHFDRRQAIRETWASGHDNVYFVVGQACRIPPDQRANPQFCDVEPVNEAVNEVYADLTAQDENDLRLEEETYHDLIFTPMPESYRSLPHKLKEAYSWAVQHSGAQWIVKADDDFFVRINTASEYLQAFDATKAHIVGRIKERDLVRRKGKWGEFDYQKRFYPPFAIGSAGHAVSRPVAEYVAANKDELFEYQGEDTSLAIWLNESGLKVTFKKTPVFDNTGRCNLERFYVIGHKIDPRKMRICYQRLDEVKVEKGHENYVEKRKPNMDPRQSVMQRFRNPFGYKDVDPLRRGSKQDQRLALYDRVRKTRQDIGGIREEIADQRASKHRTKEYADRRAEFPPEMGMSRVRALTSTVSPSEATIQRTDSEQYQNVTSSMLQPNSWLMPQIANQKMVVIVMTARRNTEKRAAIRETWAKGHSNVYFILSDPCPFPKKQMHTDLECKKAPSMKHDPVFPEHKMWMKKEQKALLVEQKEHRDMIYTPGIESYHGLVRKLKEACDWVVSNTKADWVLKADDDMFVRVDLVARYLSTLSPKNPTVVGRIISQAQVATSGKWADPDYRELFYPPWPQGSCGYVVSRNIAEYVGKSKATLYEYQGEDSSLGIWVNESKIKQAVNWHNSRAFVNHGDCEDSIALAIGHDITPEQMRICYKARDEINDLPDHAFDDFAFDSIANIDGNQRVPIVETSMKSLGSRLCSWFC